MIKNLPKNRFAAIVALFISLLMPTVAKAQEAYVVEDGTTLTFYYDDQRTNRTGTVYGINQKREDDNYHPAWAGSYSVKNDRITKAVFDASFKNFLPTSTAYWFYNCTALATIERIENLNTANVTEMYSMFEGCSALTALDLSNFNTEKVTNMSFMFDGCKALTSLDLSNFNTENVTNMRSLFWGCSSLTTLDVTGFNTAKVTNMLGIFFGCSALTSLNLSSFNTMKVADISSMFSGCESLTSLDVSKFSVDKVVNMKHMFSDCAQLTTIVCDDAWSCPDSKKMFDDCTKLKGAAEYDESMTDAAMANPETGYFTRVGASSVSEVNADTESGATVIYNLNGVKMHDDLQSLPAGIYIVNGKKVIVK